MDLLQQSLTTMDLMAGLAWMARTVALVHGVSQENRVRVHQDQWETQVWLVRKEREGHRGSMDITVSKAREAIVASRLLEDPRDNQGSRVRRAILAFTDAVSGLHMIVCPEEGRERVASLDSPVSRDLMA